MTNYQRIGLVIWLALLVFPACRGRDGRDGAPGMAGQPGMQGPPGLIGTVPFSYEGSMIFPTTEVTQKIPGLDMERGDVVNVYLRYHGDPTVWTQITSTLTGGQIGNYYINGDLVTILTPANVTVDWLIDGFKNT